MTMKKAFTLIEVNLAMMIMAGGILSIVALYAFGFRENRQGREDVAAAACADSVMSPLIMALSSPDVTWDTFNSLKNYPDDHGWKKYFDENGVVTTDPRNEAIGVFDKVMGVLSPGGDYRTTFPNDALDSAEMTCGLVVRHPKDSATVSVAFRAVPRNQYNTLLAMPLFFTEVRFQGKVRTEE